MNEDKILYQLVVEDIQTVAQDEIGRELTDKEITLITDTIAEKINWYDAIANSINEHIPIKKDKVEKIE